MDIHFNCPNCTQTLAVDREAVGTDVNCPTCGGGITIPQHAAEPPSLSQPKRLVDACPEPLATVHVKSLPEPVQVIVRDFEMSFGAMVTFILKWALALIAALLILAVAASIVAGILYALTMAGKMPTR